MQENYLWYIWNILPAQNLNYTDLFIRAVLPTPAVGICILNLICILLSAPSFDEQ